VVVFSVNNSRYGLAWRGFTLSWYEKLFQNEYILEAAYNSLIVALISTLIATIIGTSLAIGLDRYPWSKNASRVFNLCVNLPIVVPDIIMAVALTMAFSFMRVLTDLFEVGLFTLILAHVTFQISFVTLTVRSKLAVLDRELDLAAKDLNAVFFYSLRRVTLPLLTPAIIAGAMLAFTLSLDDFIISFFVHGPDSVTLPIYIFASLKRGITPEIHALSTVMLVATIILIILAEKLGTHLILRSKRRVIKEVKELKKLGNTGGFADPGEPL
jgi:spermidine/putrescine transport system permease protein